MISEPLKLDTKYGEQISHWSSIYNLTPVEIERLKAVLVDYPPDSFATEMEEELRCIMAARKLAVVPALTQAEVDRARKAFESGSMPFVRQDVD